MLQAIRDASKSWIMKGILIILAATFVVFFGNDIVGTGGSHLGGGGTSSVIEVGGVDYSVHDVGREFNRQMRQLQTDPRFAGLTQDRAIELGLLDQTINQMVARTLFNLGARDLGVFAGDGNVSELVRQVPQFQNQAGRFDRNIFEVFLQGNNITEQQYVDQLRGDLVRSQLIDTINAGVSAPASLVDLFYRFNGERRIAEYVVIDAATVPANNQPDEAQIGAYFGANKARFETPEYRSGLIVALTPEQLAQEIGISEDEIVEAFDSRRSEFIAPELRRIESALFENRVEADDALKRVRAGEAFDVVVGEVSGLPPVDLGLFAEGQAPVEEIGEAAFAMADVGVGDPIESPFGWTLVRVVEIQASPSKGLEDVRDEVRDTLALEKARETIFDVLEAFEDALAGGATLEAAANEAGLKTSTIEPVSAVGALKTGTASEAVDREVVVTLFSTVEGEQSPAVERRDGGFFALRVDSVQPPAIPSLIDVRENVAAAWAEEQRQTEAEKLATTIADEARGSGSLAAAAAKAGLAAETTPAFDRLGTGATIPAEAIDLVFEGASGDVVQAITTGGAVVARVVDIVAVVNNTEQVDQLRTAIAQSIANDLQVQFVEALRTEFPVEIDSEELQRTFSQQ